MPFVEDMGGWLSWLKRYAFGRGLMTTATLVATGISMALGGGVLLPALVITLGGTLLHGYNRLSEQREYETQMVELYRNDIAAELGKAPDDITRADLKEAAKTNEVLGQALERQRDKTIISIGTAALSGAVTFGLVYFLGAGEALHEAVKPLGKFFGPLVGLVGIGTVSSITGLFLHTGLELLIGHKTGAHKAAAHDMIMAMGRELSRGHGISREQVYAVLVASDDTLAARIVQQTGRDYRKLNAVEQRALLSTIGVDDAMQQLADDINRGSMKPGHLAYMIGEEFEQTHPHTSTLPHTHSNFVERLGLAPRASHSHVEALRAAPAPAAGIA